MIIKPVVVQALLALLLLTACSRHGHDDQHAVAEEDSTSLFVPLPAATTHIDFSNTLTEGLNTNVLLYEYFYNGGGVAVGDFNGDGLQDLYFTGNMTSNKLYLNKGLMQFEDITDQAGVAGRPGPWKTGVAVADVNGDGRPDIFICYSGKLPGSKRVKQLFINDGNDAFGIPHFSEQAAKFGLADSSYTTQAYFFDYDRDGDLDLLLLNHNPKSLPVLNETSTAALLTVSDVNCGVRLLRNDNGYFHDITESTGISSSALTYGLGAGIADINGDGWPDIYISNDYTVPDYYYINDHKGHFVNELARSMGHISQFSMGNNVADINNDGLPDIFTLDMLPQDNRRQKLLFAPDNYEKFDLNIRSGFHYQYMRNMLQLNNGDGTFSEIGQLAGISNTDWSWAPLFADLDNDGWKDLFVTNGYLRDYTNMDFIKFMDNYTREKGRLKREDVMDIVSHMPSSNVTSYLFHNNGDLTFTNVTAQWGIHTPSNSNGAAWVDLDNDGDLDLVVNNINQGAFLYENRAERMGRFRNHYLQIKLEGIRGNSKDRGGNQKGPGGNTEGIGAKLLLFSGGKKQYLEQMPTQGYQSTVSSILHFGLGQDSVIDSLRVIWPRGQTQLIIHPARDRIMTLKEADAGGTYQKPMPPAPLFKEIRAPLVYHHPSAAINDFKRQPLLVNPLSFSGPCLVKGDVNGDGLEDIYTGAGNGQPGILYLQQKDGRFLPKTSGAFDADRGREDADAVFFDANGDGKPDLYIASGGYHNFAPDDTLLSDRLYLGDGKGNFTRTSGLLPSLRVSKSCVRVADVNGDGYPDLFVGGRVIPGEYPQTPSSFLLINDGKGHFTDMINELAPGLQKAGMVTDAVWADMNGDGVKDLVVAGEWMPIMIFINEHGKLMDRSSDFFEKPYYGWWNKLLVDDLDGDGLPEIVAGNLGLNASLKASDRHPAELYYKDFDGNGTLDPILCFYIGDTSYPFLTRDELIQQIGNMNKRFPDYESFSQAVLQTIFPGDELKGAGHLQAGILETVCFSRKRGGRFKPVRLPLPAQFSPVCTITELDYDHDGKKDLLLCGNINHARLRFGKSDANYGVLLRGDGKGGFSYIDQPRSGFHLRGDVRSVIVINDVLLFGINQDTLRAYRCSH